MSSADRDLPIAGHQAGDPPDKALKTTVRPSGVHAGAPNVCCGCHERALATIERDGSHPCLALTRGDEGDLAAIRRPGRPVVISLVPRHAPDVASRQLEDPDVVVAGPVRREGDASTVGRPVRLAIVEGPRRNRRGAGSVTRDRPDIPRPVAIGLERDPPSVGGPRRLPGIMQKIRDAPGLAA